MIGYLCGTGRCMQTLYDPYSRCNMDTYLRICVSDAHVARDQIKAKTNKINLVI